MKFLNFDNVLCLSPHPDDVEYGMAGTILKYNDTHFDIFCLTLGTSTDDTSTVKRLDEIATFWHMLDVFNVNIIEPKVEVFEELTNAKWVTHIEAVADFEHNTYDAICGTSKLDSHQEHRFVNGMLSTLARSNPMSIVEYKSPSTLHDWTPNCFIGIDDFYTMKVKRLQTSFKTQSKDSYYFKNACMKAFHTDYLSMKKGYGMVEQYNIINLYQ